MALLYVLAGKVRTDTVFLVPIDPDLLVPLEVLMHPKDPPELHRLDRVGRVLEDLLELLMGLPAKESKDDVYALTPTHKGPPDFPRGERVNAQQIEEGGAVLFPKSRRDVIHPDDLDLSRLLHVCEKTGLTGSGAAPNSDSTCHGTLFTMGLRPHYVSVEPKV